MNITENSFIKQNYRHKQFYNRCISLQIHNRIASVGKHPKYRKCPAMLVCLNMLNVSQNTSCYPSYQNNIYPYKGLKRFYCL